jgi:hypothetical protein
MLISFLQMGLLCAARIERRESRGATGTAKLLCAARIERRKLRRATATDCSHQRERQARAVRALGTPATGLRP